MTTSSARVVVIIVPRERFSGSVEALDALYERTGHPFDLVYIDGNAPKAMAAQLQERADRHGFVLERHTDFLSPNAARNRGIALAQTHYPDHDLVAFLDNDVLVDRSWLQPLVDAIDETAAWVVGPMTLQGSLEDREIHIAGGYFEFEGDAGRRTLRTDHRFQGQTIPDVSGELVRATCDFAEFHSMLTRRDALERVGPLDERLMNSREHLDDCLDVSAAGGKILFEPASHVTYTGPATIETGDLRFYLRRWSDEWTSASLARFVENYELDPAYLDRVAISRARRRYALKMWARGLVERPRSALAG